MHENGLKAMQLLNKMEGFYVNGFFMNHLFDLIEGGHAKQGGLGWHMPAIKLDGPW